MPSQLPQKIAEIIQQNKLLTQKQTQLEEDLLQSESRASRVLESNQSDLQLMQKDFSSVQYLAKQEAKREYQQELKALRIMIIQLKNKYSLVLDQKATQFKSLEKQKKLNVRSTSSLTAQTK